MPNPFPGMNPYLENPRRWRDVHGALIYAFRTELSRTLPSQFAAIVEGRVYVQETFQDYVADALVIETITPKPSQAIIKKGIVTTLARPEAKPIAFDTPKRLIVERTTERERFIEVRTGNNLEEVIAVIEFLSPANKTTRSGRKEYKSKQNNLLSSSVHLLEIDLLRDGTYTLAPPERELRAQFGHFDYLVSLHRAGDADEYDLWPVTVRDRLPRLLLPLTNDEEVVVDMQGVLKRAYRDGYYDRLVNYQEPPNPPLSPGDAAWANALIEKMDAENGIINTQVSEADEATDELEIKDF